MTKAPHKTAPATNPNDSTPPMPPPRPRRRRRPPPPPPPPTTTTTTTTYRKVAGLDLACRGAGRDRAPHGAPHDLVHVDVRARVHGIPATAVTAVASPVGSTLRQEDVEHHVEQLLRACAMRVGHAEEEERQRTGGEREGGGTMSTGPFKQRLGNVDVQAASSETDFSKLCSAEEALHRHISPSRLMLSLGPAQGIVKASISSRLLCYTKNRAPKKNKKPDGMCDKERMGICRVYATGRTVPSPLDLLLGVRSVVPEGDHGVALIVPGHHLRGKKPSRQQAIAKDNRTRLSWQKSGKNILYGPLRSRFAQVNSGKQIPWSMSTSSGYASHVATWPIGRPPYPKHTLHEQQTPRDHRRLDMWNAPVEMKHLVLRRSSGEGDHPSMSKNKPHRHLLHPELFAPAPLFHDAPRELLPRHCLLSSRQTLSQQWLPLCTRRIQARSMI